MSINAIEGVSSARPANKAYELYAASLAEQNQQAPAQEFGSALQQMMDTPSVAMAMASAQEERPRASSGATARKAKRPAKRKARSAR